MKLDCWAAIADWNDREEEEEVNWANEDCYHWINCKDCCHWIDCKDCYHDEDWENCWHDW